MCTPCDSSLIIARAPLRISFAGGGTDLPAYYERYGGIVLSATISRSVYAVLAPGDYEPTQISSSNYRALHVSRRGPDDHDGSLTLPWAVVQAMGVERGASIMLSSEAPPGTGLGSSSATTAALIRAIAAWRGHLYTPTAVAELAAEIEIVHLGQPIGKQDQYATAFGGVNVFEFGANEVVATPVPLRDGVREGLEAHLRLYFTGGTRQAGDILREQRFRTERGESRTMDALHAIKAGVASIRAALDAGNYAAMGSLLHEAWQLKRQVSSGISTGSIDAAYSAARAAGAWGGKITGAGGGGFMLLLVPPDAHARVDAALTPLGLRRMSFMLEPLGARSLVEGRHDRPTATGRTVAVA